MMTTSIEAAAATAATEVIQSKPRARKSAGKAATESGTVPGPADPDPATARVSRTDQLIAMLRTADGASIEDLCKRFGWLPHSARAAMTGLRKRGLDVQRSKAGTVTIYRIAVV
jgi:hypothetical protein